MQQLEIQYFFPLTEQIPLDLNYVECDKPNLWTTISLTTGGTGFTLTAGGGTVSWSQRIGEWEIPNETKHPSNLQKFLMKYFLGWKWMGK
jgi:hypothetical protein